MRFLITRPLPKAKSTQSALVAAGFSASIAPVIQIDILATDSLRSTLNKSVPDILIITSTYAVDWLALQALTINLNTIDIVCIGQSTARYLRQSFPTINQEKPIIVPTQENSEGLLTLPVLQQVSGKKIVILKGEGGRPLIAQTLRERTAILTELCVYKRCLNKHFEVNNDYKQSDIQCIIVTSIEIAQAVFSLYEKVWLQNLTWMVASQRIKDYAIQHGISSIIESQGASPKAIVDCATQLVNTGVVND